MRSDLRQLLRRHRVLFMPGLPARRLLLRPKNCAATLPFPFDHPRLVLTSSGRGALYQAAQLLGLTSRDTVLCPAYNCGHEVEPFLRLQVPVRFYSVGRRLEVDSEDLRRSLDAVTPRLLLVTHYFGFPQDLVPLRRLCEERRIVLLEHCAHALLGRDLGRTGHLAVFSLQKTLALPHGGALVVNDPSLAGALPAIHRALAQPSWLATGSRIFELWQKSLLSASQPSSRFLLSRLLLLVASPLILSRRLARRSAWQGRSAVERRFGFPDQVLSWGLSRLAERLLAGVDFEAVFARRRSNFQFLLESLHDVPGVDPVFSHLPDGVCPLAFPFLSHDARGLVRRLHEKGIGATHWWSPLHPAVPWESFPHAVFLKGNLVALPVHQGLDGDPLARMAEEVRRLAG